ncbi:NAD-dependent epimerase/dehydratase family protein [Phytomonospora endophytica]|uniref:Nucleoside-diphosphate-sugar epimerase n=1 Tax=Phytomonospora endophytica TaxID=714109 RepID=A0A841FXD8_9ACTN|nr:NAD-dependent epimerase/dehydratase family protein [Phytomonospora endophytica]MBB6039403.1 nucleoside-diphosphate-sugar epimerase [Phytomonospora endophytica]GIG70130.1 reductase [Phytomonospora endophytica]
MRVLILGGNVYLSKATARRAIERGHDVTVASRGTSGEPPEGARFTAVDRSTADGMSALRGQTFDAVIDVARVPLHVKNALDVLGGSVGHYGFVSTRSVYTDHDTVGATVAGSPVFEPTPDDGADFAMELYGPNKVACENLVRAALPAAHAIYRAGLVIGPGDPGDRFGYWPWRIAQGGEVLAPGDPAAPLQWIDVEDLADWAVDAAEKRTTGTFDGVQPAVSWREFLDGVAEGAGTRPTFTWVPPEHITAAGVGPWSGPDSLPLWVGGDGYGGFMNRDVSASLAAGMPARPVADTTRRWLAWNDGSPAVKAGITREKEAEILAAFHAR